mmetsp:Transcript_7856/g.12468  ORF Transcript_7856/g.12468 Transcript_7856/m.12468 type:complete len:226 (+) Transcript_7856:2304-2981(+)
MGSHKGLSQRVNIGVSSSSSNLSQGFHFSLERCIFSAVFWNLLDSHFSTGDTILCREDSTKGSDSQRLVPIDGVFGIHGQVCARRNRSGRHWFCVLVITVCTETLNERHRFIAFPRSLLLCDRRSFVRLASGRRRQEKEIASGCRWREGTPKGKTALGFIAAGTVACLLFIGTQQRGCHSRSCKGSSRDPRLRPRLLIRTALLVQSRHYSLVAHHFRVCFLENYI